MIFRTHIKQNERGRSMVEILGVLAVIGVLSFGGIQGYKYAMDKHRANDIVHSVNMRATDIWHLYQDGEKELPDSPDEDAFPEYGEMTQTGFEIMVTSHPPVAFRTWVNNVPTDVCKKVLQENLNDAIQGLKFVQVENENGLVRYTGDINICGTNATLNQMVFTSFLDEDGGAVTNLTDEEGRPLEHCVDTEDCESCCGTPLCDMDTMTCSDGCTLSGKVCNNSSCECVECMEDDDCPSAGQICDPSANQCVNVPESCGEGERFGQEYRAKNGACVPCSYMSEIVIMNSDENDGIFEVEVAGQVIKDTRSGRAMCQACASPQHRVEEGNNGGNVITYCATSCIIGNSFLNTSGDCIKCSADSDQSIPDDDKSRLLCDSCTGRISVGGDYRGWHCARKTCPDGWYKVRDARCVKCDKSNIGDWTTATDFHGGYFWASDYTSSKEIIDEWSRLCNACATSTDPSLRSNRHVLNIGGSYYCVKQCNENQFQTPDGQCWNCSNPSAVSLTGTGGNGQKLTYLKNLCTSEKCGRIYKDGYCISPNAGNSCEQSKDETNGNQFLGTDMQCYLCTTANYVKVDSKENCENACPTTRTYYNGYCYKNCNNGELHLKGECAACSTVGKGYLLTYKSWNVQTQHDTDDCNNRCKDENNQLKYMYHLYSDSITCVPRTCASGELRTAYGYCQSCLTSGSILVDKYKTECEKCPNHIYIGNYCVYYNPGVSGVCNEDSPDISKYPNISNGTTYRDNTGICRKCDVTTEGYNATQAECDSCGGIRQLVGGVCTYGGCLQNETFISRTGCVACNTASIKVETKTSAEATQLCNDCNRRIMIVNNVPYCVPECDTEEWQDIAGECHAGIMDSLDGKNEIGSDNISLNKCHNAGRIVEQEDNQYFCIPKE